MVSKVITNGLHAVTTEHLKKSSKQSNKKGSYVTDARAKAQRAKLDALTEIKRPPEEQETAIGYTQNKKASRQEIQAKRRVIETLIVAYVQGHIGGNHSKKTLEWHRTALEVGLGCL